MFIAQMLQESLQSSWSNKQLSFCMWAILSQITEAGMHFLLYPSRGKWWLA
jgi:hypothetical protein